MSIIAEFSAPTNSLSLGKCIENQPDAEIEIERVVPMRQGTFPYVLFGTIQIISYLRRQQTRSRRSPLSLLLKNSIMDGYTS